MMVLQELKSPLRYAGGKSRAINYILKFIPGNIKVLGSPFLGGGSVELACASKGIRVYGYDNFKPVVEFWQCLLQDPRKLASFVWKYHPLQKSRYYELQKTQNKHPSKYERAARYYVINRCSFSGTTLSGGMSPNHPRFTRSGIERLACFRTDKLTVEQADFKMSIGRLRNRLLYLDPPYMINQKLYGNNGDMQSGFDHTGLAKLLKNRDKWILSYNDCREIRSLYDGYRFKFPEWKYGMSNDKKSKEILILSHDLAE